MIIAAQIVSQIGGYYDARPCEQIEYIFGSQEEAISAYPDCTPFFNGSDPSKQVAVEANFNGNPVQLTVALGSNFGSAMWLAFAIHAIGVEIYVRQPTCLYLMIQSALGQYCKANRSASTAQAHACRVRAASKCLVPKTTRGWNEEPRKSRSDGRPLR